MLYPPRTGDCERDGAAGNLQATEMLNKEGGCHFNHLPASRLTVSSQEERSLPNPTCTCEGAGPGSPGGGARETPGSPGAGPGEGQGVLEVGPEETPGRPGRRRLRRPRGVLGGGARGDPPGGPGRRGLRRHQGVPGGGPTTSPGPGAWSTLTELPFPGQTYAVH